VLWDPSAAKKAAIVPIPDDNTTNDKNGPAEQGGTVLIVEVAGIEPASFVALMGLLRAQCAVSLLGLTDHAHESV